MRSEKELMIIQMEKLFITQYQQKEKIPQATEEITAPRTWM